ncbi:putative zinc-binding protein [Candidatus Hydrogenedentota bacterium]
MDTPDKQACCAAPTLIFPCSGGSDVGGISDKAGRELTRLGIGKMFCLAGIGGRVSGIMQATEAAEKLVVIDGCPLHCAKNTFTLAGFEDFVHVDLSQAGLKKGEAPITDENVSKAITQVRETLAAD